MRAALLLALAPLAACSAGAPPAVAPPSAEARTVSVASTPPGADVLVEGERRCATPCTVRLDPGRYRIAIRKSGFLPYETAVTVGFSGDPGVSAALVASH